MPYFGAHESIAGGLFKAFERINKVGGKSLQIFTRNQRQWQATDLSEEEISDFRTKWKECENMAVTSHASYLINLASGKKDIADKSINSFSTELQRCQRLGLNWVVIHPGSHGGDGLEIGLANFTTNLDAALTRAKGSKVTVLLETTAGQGSGLGSSFEELARIVEKSRYPDRLGVCVDTCHIFAAGYDIRTSESYEKTIAKLDRTIGLDRIHCFHLNDSKKGLGSRVDRHEHIGKGMIGLNGFRYLVNDPRFMNHPMVLETPKGKDLKEDVENLKTLHSLLE